jgi:hypothetical protein
MNEVRITKYIDDNHCLVLVPLTNAHKSVILYQEDFNRLIEAGVDPRWRLQSNQILERGRGGLSVTRLVAHAGEGQKVRVLDKDPCNLRKSNLITVKGRGRIDPGNKLSSEDRLAKLRSIRDVRITYDKINPPHMKEII